MEFIDLKRQYSLHKAEIEKSLQKVLQSGQYIMGEQVCQLEKILAEYVGVKHCIGVASGTDALLIALMALEIGPGDEVITTPYTWISSAMTIALRGAKPVFIDIDPETYNLDLNQMEEVITSHTKAIMPVNLFGQLPDYHTINNIAQKYNLSVIEDGAQSFGALQEGHRSCSKGTIGATSFFPAKPLGCYGDGGAVFTDDDELAREMKAIHLYGGERHHSKRLGLNSRLDSIQAAILLAKFPYFEEELHLRQKLGQYYSEHLHDYCGTPLIKPGNTHIYAQYTIRVPERDRVLSELKAAGIPCAVYYPQCLHQQKAFSYLDHPMQGAFPHAEKASEEVLSLPMHPWLTTAEQDKVITTLQNLLS
ncbi:MAG: DegT/DnrJ/EryC1/StrS family aminotransferase [Chlamydiota bacterium]